MKTPQQAEIVGHEQHPTQQTQYTRREVLKSIASSIGIASLGIPIGKALRFLLLSKLQVSSNEAVSATATAVAENNQGNLRSWLENQGATPEIWNNAVEITTKFSVPKEEGEPDYYWFTSSGAILGSKGNYLYILTARHSMLFESKEQKPGPKEPKLEAVQLLQPHQRDNLDIEVQQSEFSWKGSPLDSGKTQDVAIIRVKLTDEQKQNIIFSEGFMDRIRDSLLSPSDQVFSLSFPEATQYQPYAEVGTVDQNLELSISGTYTDYKSNNIAVSPGSSGSVLFDKEGKIAGICIRGTLNYLGKPESIFTPLNQQVVSDLIHDLDAGDQEP